MKKKLIPAVLAAVMALSATTAYADEKNPELGMLYRYIGDTYDVEIIDPDITGTYVDESEMWDCRRCDDGDGLYLLSHDILDDYSKDRIKVPDSYNGVAVKRIEGSCVFKEFDLNPKNKYMKLIDNVVFSKDGKTLMSYAQYDERTSYEIPYFTKYINTNAFYCCNNLRVLKMSDSVEEIAPMAIVSLDNIKEIYLSPNVSVISKSSLCCNRTLNLVYLPKDSKITKIDHDAFHYTALKELKLPSFEIDTNL